MNELHYTLLSDGPADKALMPILKWLLQQRLVNVPIQSHWADLSRLRRPPRELHEKIQKSVEVYPCDLLFVHRDAETASLEDRLTEISNAIAKAGTTTAIPLSIGVVPVRMTEAWLLFDTNAIREAAGNPNGTVHIDLPAIGTLEDLPNPKSRLHALMLEATGLVSRRRRRFDVNSAVQLIPEYIEDFSPLRALPAFSSLENRVTATINNHGWCD
jgi:hypothetical protein